MKNISFIPIVISSLLVVGAACSKDTVNQNTSTVNQGINTSLENSGGKNANTAQTGSSSVSWSFGGSAWQSSGTPPACPEPLTVRTPVDLSTASAILYPGQTRGGNYKPHGGFLFRTAVDNKKTVIAPMDAMVYNGSRYIEQGETQYLFTFIHPCGIAYRFDHLLTLSPAMQAIADTLPPAQVNNSATTMIKGKRVTAGDILATEIGFRKNRNVSVDFGVYDLRKTNGEKNGGAEYGQHGLCWLNLLGNDMAAAKALPGGDQSAGKTSDYCSS